MISKKDYQEGRTSKAMSEANTIFKLLEKAVSDDDTTFVEYTGYLETSLYTLRQILCEMFAQYDWTVDFSRETVAYGDCVIWTLS